MTENELDELVARTLRPPNPVAFARTVMGRIHGRAKVRRRALLGAAAACLSIGLALLPGRQTGTPPAVTPTLLPSPAPTSSPLPAVFLVRTPDLEPVGTGRPARIIEEQGMIGLRFTSDDHDDQEKPR